MILGTVIWIASIVAAIGLGAYATVFAGAMLLGTIGAVVAGAFFLWTIACLVYVLLAS